MEQKMVARYVKTVMGYTGKVNRRCLIIHLEVQIGSYRNSEQLPWFPSCSHEGHFLYQGTKTTKTQCAGFLAKRPKDPDESRKTESK